MSYWGIVAAIVIPAVIGVISGHQMHRQDVKREIFSRTAGVGRTFADLGRDELAALLLFATTGKRQ